MIKLASFWKFWNYYWIIWIKGIWSSQWRSIFVNVTKISEINLNPFCFWYNSLVEVEIWTKVITKKCLYAKILKTGIFMFGYRFFHIDRRSIWVIQQNFVKLNVFPNLKIDMLQRGHCTDFTQFTWLFYLTCQVF